jgi:hypothetical protein
VATSGAGNTTVRGSGDGASTPDHADPPARNPATSILDLLAQLIEAMIAGSWGWKPTFQLSFILFVVLAGVTGTLVGVGFLAHSLAVPQSPTAGMVLGGAGLGAFAAAGVGYVQRKRK